MGITRSISKIHPIVVVLVILACVGVSTWALVTKVAPEAERLLALIVSKYDEYLPEITIQDGQAGIREEQPYYVEKLTDEEGAVVIDTREGKQDQALNYLKDYPNGAVLTRDTLVVKQPSQIRIIPLEDCPDLVFNSRNLKELGEQFLPLVIRIGTVAVALLYLFAKPLQILLMALIPYFGARWYSVSLTYGGAFKIAAFAMIPPVILDLLWGYSGILAPRTFVVYFGVYIILMILAAKDVISSAPAEPEPSFAIKP